jgi:hypothetical protein
LQLLRKDKLQLYPVGTGIRFEPASHRVGNLPWA